MAAKVPIVAAAAVSMVAMASAGDQTGAQLLLSAALFGCYYSPLSCFDMGSPHEYVSRGALGVGGTFVTVPYESMLAHRPIGCWATAPITVGANSWSSRYHAAILPATVHSKSVLGPSSRTPSIAVYVAPIVAPIGMGA